MNDDDEDFERAYAQLTPEEIALRFDQIGSLFPWR